MESSAPEPLPALRWVDHPDQARSLLDPLRSAILDRLREPGSSTSVASTLQLPRQRVNYHVRALEEEGLLEHVEDRRKGNCVERIVRATADRYAVNPGIAPTPAGPSDGGEGRADPFSSRELIEGATRTLREVAELEVRNRGTGQRLPSLALEVGIRFRSARDEVEFAKALQESLETLRARYHTPSESRGRPFRIAVAGHLDPDALPRS